jgi:hypothetical protein
MSTDSPIFAELEAKAKRARHAIAADFEAGMEAGAESITRATERVFGHGRYHAASVSENVPEESPVNLTELAADIRTDLQSAEDKAGEVYNHAKAVLEEKLPQIEAIGQEVGSDKLFQFGIDATIPAPLRQLGADILGKLFAAFPAQQAAPAEAPAEPAEAPAA